MATATVDYDLDNAVKTDDGKWKIQISVEGRTQTFIYENERDLSQQLLKAQAHASKKISEQEKRLRELTPLEASQQWRDHNIAEGRKFRAQNPDLLLYDPGDQMKIEQLIYQKMIEKFPDIFNKAQKENFTAENLGQAYMELGESGLLPARPEAAPQPPLKEPGAESAPQAAAEEHPPVNPARTFSTGVRNGTHSAPPAPKRKSDAEVWAEIDAMSPDAYDRKLATDPAFRKMVDSLPAR